MGISVEGQKCPVCGGYLFDNDDLVFCPECGAPHHRDCYAAVGHCGLAQYHGTEQEYRRPATPKDADTADAADAPTGEENGANTAGRPCPTCGQAIPSGSAFCPHCGAQVGSSFQPLGFTPAFDPMGGVGENELIEDVPAGQVRDYVAVNTPRYLPRFKQLNKRKRLSWNWAAFFFPNAWFFYRKIYLPGILFFLLTLTASGLSNSMTLILQTMPDEALKSYGAMFSYLSQNLPGLNPWPVLLSVIGLIISLAVRVAAGLTGDWFYRSSAVSRIHKVNDSDPPVELSLALRQAGGVNPFLGMLGLFALQWLVYFFYMLV